MRHARYIYILLIGLTVLGCKKEETGQAPAAALPPSPVEATAAIARDVPDYIDEIGTCTSPEVVEVRPQAAGRIKELYFIDGAEIKKGDLLAVIDPRPYQAQLDQAKANLAQTQANLELAKRDFARVQELIRSNAMSQEQYESRENVVKVAEAEIKVRQAAIEVAQVNLDYCSIHSPINGRAGKRLLDVGNVVKSDDDRAIVVIQRMDPIYVDFTTSENRLDEVRARASKGTLQTLARLPEEPMDSARQGELTFLDNSVQSGTGTIKLRATVPNADRHFWPGQFVNVRLVLQVVKDAVLIPNKATQVSQTGYYVYVVRPDSTAELRPIKLGQQQGSLIVVTEGLKAGETVVTAGQLAVRPDGPVRILEPSSQPATAPSTQPSGASS